MVVYLRYLSVGKSTFRSGVIMGGGGFVAPGFGLGAPSNVSIDFKDLPIKVPFAKSKMALPSSR